MVTAIALHMNLITLFILSVQREQLLQLLQEYAGILTPQLQVLNVEELPEVLTDPQQPPTWYRVFQNGSWLVVEVNSVMKLHSLAAKLSSALSTNFLQIIHCEPVEYSYLLYYNKGNLIREIEAKGHKPAPDVNIGQPFTFEETPLQYFDLDWLAYYCREWDIDLSNLYGTATCTVLEKKSNLPAACMEDVPAMTTLLLQ